MCVGYFGVKARRPYDFDARGRPLVLYGPPLIVVDFGTAGRFDCSSRCWKGGRRAMLLVIGVGQ